MSTTGIFKLNKKGYAVDGEDVVFRRQEDQLELYEYASRDLRDEFGIDLWVAYGTLLGLHRDNSLIPHDDDFDAAFLSQFESITQVRRECVRLMRFFVLSGRYTVSLNARGGPFRLSDMRGCGHMRIDVQPLWYENGLLQAHWHQPQLMVPYSDIFPLNRIVYREHVLQLPRRPEAFLHEFYGDWQTPNPNFFHNVEPDTKQARKRRNKKLGITLHQYRSLHQDLQQHGLSASVLTHVGLTSLYPLNFRATYIGV
jgi:hypothetical protein